MCNFIIVFLSKLIIIVIYLFHSLNYCLTLPYTVVSSSNNPMLTSDDLIIDRYSYTL